MAPVKPVVVDFGPVNNAELEKYVWNNIMALKTGLRDLHTEKVTKWRRIYKGVPEEETRSWPWKDASNVIIQVIGENVDTLTAFILGSIYEVMPLYSVGLVGGWKPEEQGGEMQEVIQEYMNLVGLEPAYLDLYRVESAAFDEGVKFGTVAIKFPYVQEMEAMAIGEAGESVGDSSKKLLEGTDFIKYEGPRPEKIEFENWAATPTAATLESAKFKYHLIKLERQDLERRAFQGVYDKKAVEEVLKKPDTPDSTEQEKLRQKNINDPQGYENEKYHIYECWFPYFHQDHTWRIIYTYHLETKTVLRKIFNFYPKNEEPWELGRLGYTDDGLYGLGYCEMLDHYQEEVSSAHNRRGDNKTLANTSILRIDPELLLDANFSVSPMSILPFREGQVEIFNLGSVSEAAVEINSEIHTIGLAKARAGTEDQGMQAPGGATTNRKGGLSAMGTFSVMQAGNRRRNVKVTDMRYLHLKMGRKLLNQYAEFGTGDVHRYFGDRAKYLIQALEEVKKGRLYLPIRAATASINKELEKQNDMLLTQVMQRHHMGVSQILQAVNNPVLPEELKKFMIGWIDSASIVMSRILRNFGYDDVSRLLPEKTLIEGANQNGANKGAAGATGGATGAAPVQQDSQTAFGGAESMVGSTNGEAVSGVPTGNVQ